MSKRRPSCSSAAGSLRIGKPALEGLARVLRAQLQLDDQSISAIAALIEDLAVALADPPAEIPALSGDPADDRIIAAAVAAGAEVLVSGDRKHVLPLGKVGAMRITRPQDLLAELSS